MKPEKKNGKGIYLKKTNNRWKWMAGATAASVAGATASQASTITLNLVNNYISGSGGNHLNADLTGDGHPDLTIANAIYMGGYSLIHSTAKAILNGVGAFGGRTDYGTGQPYNNVTGHMTLGSRHAFYSKDGYGFVHGTRSLTGSIPIFFKDLHINGGTPTRGSLEVTVSPGEIQLDSFTYNDPPTGHSPTVPDRGSSLALLAMGASGILALRRWRAAQSQS